MTKAVCIGRAVRCLARGILAACAATAVGACDRKAEPQTETLPEPAAATAVEPAPTPEPTGLKRATEAVFGIATPEGLRADGSGENFAHFRIRASFSEIVQFFQSFEPQMNYTDYQQGGKFEFQDQTGRSVYIYRGRSRQEHLVTYFNSGATETLAAARAASDGVALAPPEAPTGAAPTPPATEITAMPEYGSSARSDTPPRWQPAVRRPTGRQTARNRGTSLNPGEQRSFAVPPGGVYEPAGNPNAFY